MNYFTYTTIVFFFFTLFNDLFNDFSNESNLWKRILKEEIAKQGQDKGMDL
jgi:hypothetical protein